MSPANTISDTAGIAGLPTVAPVALAADAMDRRDPLDVRFEGFGPEAFDVLEQLRRRPHIEEYRKQKPRIRAKIQEPFKRYRDDLVVNWVLPNRLGLETEKNVFSRVLKNDFGAGGCHHHFWMSFYRPGRSRLKDVQLAHSLWPEALYIVAYVGKPVPGLFRNVRRRLLREHQAFLESVNPLLQKEHATLRFHYAAAGERLIVSEPLDQLPEEFERAKEVAVRLAITRDEVVEAGPRLIEIAIDAIVSLWPIYRFFLEASTDGS